MIKEYAKEGHVGRLLAALLAACAPYILANLWNYSDEKRRRFEESLPPYRRWGFHIVNTDGTKMYYLPLPLDDMLDFLGIQEDATDFMRYEKGYISAPQLVGRIAVNSFYQPWTKVINSIGGVAGVIRDATGYKTFPDFADYKMPWDKRITSMISDVFGSPGNLTQLIERGEITIDDDGQLVMSQKARDTLNRAWTPMRPYTPDYDKMRRVLLKSVYKETTKRGSKGQPHKGEKRNVDILRMQLEGIE
jgi:hypothetical protein